MRMPSTLEKNNINVRQRDATESCRVTAAAAATADPNPVTRHGTDARRLLKSATEHDL